MKKTYSIYLIKEIEVCIPNTDFYDNKDFQTETINSLEFISNFNSEEEAISFLETDIEYISPEHNYTILTIYSKL